MTNNKETGYSLRYEDMVWMGQLMCEVNHKTMTAHPYKEADTWELGVKRITYFDNLYEEKNTLWKKATTQ